MKANKIMTLLLILTNVISNAFKFKDKSILFYFFKVSPGKSKSLPRMLIISMCITCVILIYLSLAIHNIYFFKTNPVYYSIIMLILISILPMLSIIIFYYEFELLAFYTFFSVNCLLSILAFRIGFAFYLVYVNNFVLETYFVLSNRYNPMDISNMLNPASSSSNAGGSGGGPSNPTIPVVPPQDNSGQTQDNQANATNEGLANQYDYSQLGNNIENQVNAVLAQRQQSIIDSPTNPSGKPAKISEIINLRELRLTKDDKIHLKELANSPNLPTTFNSFKNAFNSNSSTATVYSRSLKYSLINYIKSYN